MLNTSGCPKSKLNGAVLAIDQGTTSTRSIVFDAGCQPLAMAQRELPQLYPADGWVEHDADIIWRDVLATARTAMDQAAVPIHAIGIANQRETVVLWDRATGAPVHNAIVWQDRRTAAACERLRDGGVEPVIRARTGLLLDPYFSATKLAWLLDQGDHRARAGRGELACGTIDSFLLWRLTEGRVHATDATNAARTSLFDIHRQCWDDDLLELFGIPRCLLPEVGDNAALYGETTLFGAAIPIAGMAGDQQAAMIGQACFAPGMVKSTYGTGCFALVNTGAQPVASKHGLLTTPAYRLNGVATFALEGAIFVAGASVTWLRDGLGLITHAGQTAEMAARVADNHGVYLVPGFVGLGAPHWDPHARGVICGLTLDATAAHIARAALEAVAYQTHDLMGAMASDIASDMRHSIAALRVDGGMAGNDWFCQFLADMLERPVERPDVIETTARGAAFLAGLATGLHDGLDAVAGSWASARRSEPGMAASARAAALGGWRDAMRRTLTGSFR